VIKFATPLKLASLKTLFESSPTAISILRMKDGLIVEVNASFIALTGYRAEELIGHTSKELRLWRNPGDRTRLLSQLKQKGHAPDFFHEWRLKSGEICHIVSSVHVFELDNIPYVLTFMTDLRKLEKIQFKLLKSADRLTLAESAAKVGFWEWDAASNRHDWSRGMEILYGVDGFKGSYLSFLRRVFPGHWDRLNQVHGMSVLSFELEFCIKLDDGTERWMNSRISRIYGPDGKLIGENGISIDISKIMLEKQLALLQAEVMNNMVEGVVVTSADRGTILFANTCFCNMLGYNPTELEGCNVAMLNAPSGDSALQVNIEITAELVRNGLWEGEIENLHKDGRHIWCRWKVSGLDHVSKGWLWVGVCSNITDERVAQINLNETHQQLQRLAANLQESVEQERSALSREVHDQIGSALTGIRMQIEALALRTTSVDMQKDLMSIAQAVRETMEVARNISSKLRPPLLDDLGLSEACRWYLRDWRHKTGLRATGRFPRLMSEPNQTIGTDLFRILQELLANVAAHSGCANVSVNLSSGQHTLRLRVADDGHGFSTAEKTSGYGLAGLRVRAAQHKGKIAIVSSTAGTVVTVTIPHIQ
jgi:PAS domain S-box-containing protein